MFHRKSNKPKGLHISNPILLPSPNPELPLPPPPRPYRPERPWDGLEEHNQTVQDERICKSEDEERDSQILLDIVNEYHSRQTLRQIPPEAHDGEEAITSASPQQQEQVQSFQRFVRDLQREAALASPALAYPHNHAARLPKPMQAPQIKQDLPLAEKILRKVARGPDSLQEQRGKHQLNLAEKRYHQRKGSAGDVGQGGKVPEAVRSCRAEEDEDRNVEGEAASVYPADDDEVQRPKPARPQNIQEVWDLDPPTPTDSGSPGSSPTRSHKAPLSPNPNPNHSPRLPGTYPPQHDIRCSAASSPASESTIDWNEIRFSTFARRTIAAFARNGRKRGYDPNDLITYEDMHRKKSPDEVAAEIAAAEALRDDPEQNERRFGLAWELLNGNSRKNERLGEVVVKLSRKREREDKRRAGEARDRVTELGYLTGKI
ncbi:hypothetical protein N7G274_001589 [Stereocaulon virgatum]|uniref:Uncharacterized protein n=1 Tax=Stereocaulon virgatum TaxID=373712 RepID=A0ABR4AN43_9LECA